MEKTLSVLNKLEQAGIITTYAIAGAVAATRYIEPVQTYDLDIFVLLPDTTSILLSLAPIYSYLKSEGYEPEGDWIKVEDWPVQFIPVYNRLTEEALAKSQPVLFGVIPTRVLTPEYLAAIMLDTGRPKDHIRLNQFIEFQILDFKLFESILCSHNLQAKWRLFQKRFLTPDETT